MTISYCLFIWATVATAASSKLATATASFAGSTMSMSVPTAATSRSRLDGWAPAGEGAALDGDGVARDAATVNGDGGSGEPPDGANAGRGAEAELPDAVPPTGGTVDRGGPLAPARTIAGNVTLGACAEVFDADENDPIGLLGAASSPPTAAATVSCWVDSEAFLPVVTSATVSGGAAYSNPPSDTPAIAAATMPAALVSSVSDERDVSFSRPAASNSSNNESVSSC